MKSPEALVDTVSALMDGERAQMVFTDPPYSPRGRAILGEMMQTLLAHQVDGR